MKLYWEKTKNILYREQKRAPGRLCLGYAIAVIIYGLYSKEYAYAFAIPCYLVFACNSFTPGLLGKLYGAKWYPKNEGSK